MMYFVSIYMSTELDSPLYVFDSYAEAKKFVLDDVANEKGIAASSGINVEFSNLNFDSPLAEEDTWYARMTEPSGEYVEWNITTLSNSSKNWEKFADADTSKEKENRIEVPVSGGVLVAETTKDPDYPGIDIEYIPDDESEIPLSTRPRILVERPIDGEQLRTLIWSDPAKEDYTEEITFIC